MNVLNISFKAEISYGCIFFSNYFYLPFNKKKRKNMKLFLSLLKRDVTGSP